MNDQDYIREAVELADGWHVTTGTDEFMIIGGGFSHSPPTQSMLDALAAQLVRQVDATNYRLDIGPKGTVLYAPEGGMFESPGLNPDRQMNTIKVVVDSGVLKSA